MSATQTPKENPVCTHLHKRSNDVYYFRRRVPLELVELFGCREFNESLGTKDRCTAEVARRKRSIATDAIFAKARAMVLEEQVTPGGTCAEYCITKSTYPAPDSKARPTWLDAIPKADPRLYNLLTEMYVAYENQAYVLTAIGLRTALDRSTEILGIDAAKTFEEKLAKLNARGWIGATEKEVLGVVTDAGSAAAHRGWEPDKGVIDQLLDALGVFLQRAFIVGTKALDVRNIIPSKLKRKKSTKEIDAA